MDTFADADCNSLIGRLTQELRNKSHYLFCLWKSPGLRACCVCNEKSAIPDHVWDTTDFHYFELSEKEPLKWVLDITVGWMLGQELSREVIKR